MSQDLLTRIKELRSKERLIKPDEAWLHATRQSLVLRAQRALPPNRKVAGLGLFREMFRAAFPAGVSQYISRPIFATASFVFAIMGGSMFSASAAERSLPGDFFYSLKLVTEQARIGMAASKDEKLKLKTEFTGRRVDELRQVATAPEADPQKVVDMAGVLKRDMDTLKQQLNEVAAEVSPADAVAAAKTVDKQTGEVIVALQKTKEQLTPENKEKVTEAQSAAAETSVSAIEVLAVKHQEDNGLVSVDEVTDAIKEHAKIVTDVTNVPLPVNSSSTASGTTIIAMTAPATSSTLALPAALELGSSTATATGTSVILPAILDQVKGATAQAFAMQKVKDQQATADAAQQKSDQTAATSTPTGPPPTTATGTMTATSTSPTTSDPGLNVPTSTKK